MRHVRILEGLTGLAENALFAVGDCQDFIDRECPTFCDLIDAVADGRTSATSAKLAVRMAFSNATRELEQYRKLFAGDAERAGMPYLHPSLLSFRVVKPIPEKIAATREGLEGA